MVMQAVTVVPTGLATTTGTYTGNAGANRAIPHGLGKTPSLVIIYGAAAAEDPCEITSADPDVIYQGTLSNACTAMNNTNFFVSDTHGNTNLVVYYWVAIG